MENSPETIFTDDELSFETYDKNIRQARNTLFILAGLQMLLSIYFIYNSVGTAGWISAGISALVAVIFLLLGFWTKSKPYTAIIIALVIYGLLWLGDCLIDPTYIYKGIFFKIFIIVYLAKALKGAKEAQSMKAILGR